MDKTIMLLVVSSLTVTACANDMKLGDSQNQLIRMQTVDPLAENRVPENSPPFSGEKASKAIRSNHKGEEAEKVKTKELLPD
ncbi:hypothetical protein [Photobacterium sp.]|uniref:hypothetical protein n=1 Tax=Photobacterium sp. TaxID=660 RepID=UPI00299D6B54|nr:hypothetical protein [Photobacterium sp.]MDX1302218.1 hypothetical protein [Photobacterium sp.]